MSTPRTYTPSNGAMIVCANGTGDYVKKEELATARAEAFAECARICETVYERYQDQGKFAYPENKADAETGIRTCIAEIERAAAGKEG